MATLAELGEWGLITALQRRFDRLPAGWTGIGDDAAVTALRPGQQALTTVDLLVEDVHFRRSTIAPEDLGWKALAVNLSDIAAMGGTPRWAVIGLSLPGSLEIDWLRRFYDGLAELAEATGCALVGGDTTGSTGPITISVTVVGEAETPILRSGARPGDRVFMTGHAGLSAAGLWCMENPARVEASSLERGYIKAATEAHHRPVPRLDAGRATQRANVRLAMLDDSDGLARSALLLARTNQVDVRLDWAAIPLHPAIRAIAAVADVDVARWALSGGEDYNLVGTIAPQDWPALADALAAVHAEASLIGEVLPGDGHAWLRGPDQQVHELTGEGEFVHFPRP